MVVTAKGNTPLATSDVVLNTTWQRFCTPPLQVPAVTLIQFWMSLNVLGTFEIDDFAEEWVPAAPLVEVR